MLLLVWKLYFPFFLLCCTALLTMIVLQQLLAQSALQVKVGAPKQRQSVGVNPGYYAGFVKSLRKKKEKLL